MVEKTVSFPILILACWLSSFGTAYADLLLDTNGIHFGPGDTLDISVGLADTASLTSPVDVYLAVIIPGSDGVIFITGEPGAPVLTPGSVTNPSTWVPLAVGVNLSAIGDTGLIPFLSAPLAEGVGSGDYNIAFATVLTGTLDVVESSFHTIRLLDNSIKGNLGQFEGTWNNTTFSSSGAAMIDIQEISPGVLEGTLDLDGFVGGLSDPDPETRQVSLLDGSGLIDYQTEDELINGTYSVTLTPEGDITISVNDIGVGNFFSFAATGQRDGDSVDLEYQVNSAMGVIAVGTVSGTRVTP